MSHPAEAECIHSVGILYGIEIDFAIVEDMGGVKDFPVKPFGTFGYCLRIGFYKSAKRYEDE